MTFKEYRKLTKSTTKYCLRICGILFSSCFCIIYLFTEALSTPFLKNILTIAALFLLGNLFAVFIWLLAILTSFAKVKRMSKLIDDIPQDVKEHYKISMILKTQDKKISYPNCEIISLKSNYPFKLDCDGSNVYLTLYYHISYIKIFEQQKTRFDRKYKKENIKLSGFGIMETSKRKLWPFMTQTDLDNRLKHLEEIAETENF